LQKKHQGPGRAGRTGKPATVKPQTKKKKTKEKTQITNENPEITKKKNKN
jgi:hypothetical protein